MGGNRAKGWMSLFGKDGIQPTVPKKVLRQYGNRELECITGFLNKTSRAEWIAHTKKDIILVKFKQFTLYVGKGETEHDASNVDVVGTYVGLGTPTTEEVISFFSWRVKGEQILEFSF